MQLHSYGVGLKDMTSVSVIPAHVHFETPMATLKSLKRTASKVGNQVMPNGTSDFDMEEISKSIQDLSKASAVEKFYSSVKSRLLVSEVGARIESGTQFTFDYLALAHLNQ